MVDEQKFGIVKTQALSNVVHDLEQRKKRLDLKVAGCTMATEYKPPTIFRVVLENLPYPPHTKNLLQNTKQELKSLAERTWGTVKTNHNEHIQTVPVRSSHVSWTSWTQLQLNKNADFIPGTVYHVMKVLHNIHRETKIIPLKNQSKMLAVLLYNERTTPFLCLEINELLLLVFFLM